MTTKTARDQNGAPIVSSSRDPVLGSHSYSEDGKRRRLVVVGGLHYLKGNRAPYFGVTATLYETNARGKTEDVAGGCLHEDVLRWFPDLADLVALHLSDIDGAPMHAEANGFYQLAGAVPGALGQRYHSGNSKRHFPCTPPEGKPWCNTEYREPTHDEALQSFAEHCRVSLDEAAAIRDQVIAARDAVIDDVPTHYAAAPDVNSRELANATARAEWARICETMRPRWAREAQECIAAHDLVIYGDGGLRAPDTWKGA